MEHKVCLPRHPLWLVGLPQHLSIPPFYPSSSSCMRSMASRIDLLPILRVRSALHAAPYINIGMRKTYYARTNAYYTGTMLSVHKGLLYRNYAGILGTCLVLKVLSNNLCMRSQRYKSPNQFRPVPVPWHRAVAMFLVCHDMYNNDAPRAPNVHTANSAGCRSTARDIPTR